MTKLTKKPKSKSRAICNRSLSPVTSNSWSLKWIKSNKNKFFEISSLPPLSSSWSESTMSMSRVCSPQSCPLARVLAIQWPQMTFYWLIIAFCLKPWVVFARMFFRRMNTIRMPSRTSLIPQRSSVSARRTFCSHQAAHSKISRNLKVSTKLMTMLILILLLPLIWCFNISKQKERRALLPSYLRTIT